MRDTAGRLSRVYRGGVTGSFLMLAAATITARLSPATNYEIDLYSATPIAVWIFIGASLLISISLAIHQASRSRSNRLALAAAASGALLVVSIPLIRDHHHIGEQDMMTHWGWTRELLSGRLGAFDIFYPSMHTLAGMISVLTEMPVPRIFLLFSVLITFAFILFVGLSIRQIRPRRGAFTIGVLAGLMLLPINHRAVILEASPRNFAIFLSPILLYGLFYHNVETERMDIVLIVLFAAFVTIHAQIAAALIFMLVGTALTMLTLNYLKEQPYERRRELSRYLSMPVIFALIFGIWIMGSDVFSGFLQTLVFFIMRGAETGGEIVTRGSSLSAVGGSLLEFFLKVFLIAAVFCMITTLDGASRVAHLFRQREVSRETTIYLSLLVGLVPLAMFGVLFLVTNRVSHLFRFLGVSMAVVTILGAVSLHKTGVFEGRRQVVAIPILLIAIGISLAVVFSSPLIFNHSAHVTESNIQGYETAFEYTKPGVDTYSHVRSDVSRYGHLVEGPSRLDREAYFHRGLDLSRAPDHFNNHDLPGYYPSDTYLAVTTADWQRDVVVWNGYRFNEADFRYLESDPQIQKVHSSGGATFYYVTVADE